MLKKIVVSLRATLRAFTRIILLSGSFCGTGNALGTVWHVRQDGTGNFTTIQACVNAMAGGDLCLVGAGTYNERVTFPSSKSGHAGALTIIKAETNLTVDTWGFNTSGANYIHIEGFNITLPSSLTGWTDGIGIYIGGNNHEVVSNYFHDTHYPAITGGGSGNHVWANHIYMCGSGFYVAGTGWLVEGNDVERLQYHSEIGDADFSRFFGTYHVIRSNYFHGTIQSEIGPAHVDGFQTYDDNGDTAQHIRFDGNILRDFYHEGAELEAIYHSNTFDLVFCNNVFAGSNSAIGVIASYGLQQVQIYNNTFANLACGPYFYSGTSGDVRNNIFYSTTCSSLQPGVTGGNNLEYAPGRSLSPMFAGDIVNQNPMFVDPNNYNFHLQSNSPAIDMGTALLIVTNDMDGGTRPQGLGWDIGADEYNTGIVVIAPTYATEPQSRTNAPGTTATFSATVVGTTPIGYQWLHNGAPLSNGGRVTGVFLNSLSVSNVQAADAGGYSLVASNTAGPYTSSVATLTLTGPPTITNQPVDTNVYVGGSASFSVGVMGVGPFGYQWRFNGNNLNIGGQFSGAFSPTLVLSNATYANAGGYSVVVTNASGSVTSAVAALTVNAAPTCDPPPSGLIGWWPGDGNANDIASTNNATLQGGATANAAGLVAQAFSFDGTNGYAQIADKPALRPTNLTVEAWVKFSSLDSAGSGSSPAGDQYIVFRQNSQNSNFEGFDLSKTRVAGSDVFRFLISSSTGQSVKLTSTTTISPGVWYHVAGVRGSNYTQLYVNGQLQGTAAISFAQDYGNYPLYFGTSGESFWDHKFEGTLDEVSLYNRALTSNEIAGIYAIGAGGKCKTGNGPFFTYVRQGTNFVLTLHGVAGRSYEVDMSPDLRSWSAMTNVILTNGTSATINRGMGKSNQFYRALLLP